MKKTIYKLYRHAMRRLARWLLGFWDCPSALKKDRKAIFLKGLTVIIVTVVSIALFMLMFLMA